MPRDSPCPSLTDDYKAVLEQRGKTMLADPKAKSDKSDPKRNRPKYKWHDLSAAALERFSKLPPPRNKVMVVVELDDVIRAATAAILQGLKLEGVSMTDLESLFLFQCKGFGTPSGTRDKLQQMPYTPVGEVQNFLYGLHALHGLGHQVYLCADSDKRDWLRLHHIYHGEDEVVRLLLPKHQDLSDEERQDVLAKYHAKHPVPAMKRPLDVPMISDDVALVEQLRKESHEGSVIYLTKLADMIKANSPSQVVYISATRESLHIMGDLLKDRGSHNHKLVLFGRYPWNQFEIDWSKPGAWMTYDQRHECGATLGRQRTTGEGGVIDVRAWHEAIQLFDPNALEYIFDAELYAPAGEEVKDEAKNEQEAAVPGERAPPEVSKTAQGAAAELHPDQLQTKLPVEQKPVINA